MDMVDELRCDRDCIGDLTVTVSQEIVLEIHVASVVHTSRCGLQKQHESPIQSIADPDTTNPSS
jgi:hypothetical protein